MGYPTYAAFNIDRIVDIYFVGVLLFPILAIALYLSLARFAGPAGSRRDPDSISDAQDAPETPRLVWIIELARSLGVGALLGLELGIILDVQAPSLWLLLIGTAAVYTVVIRLAALAIQRLAASRRQGSELRAGVNAAAGPVLLLLGLFGVSAVTQVIVRSDGSIHHYPWFPWWLAGAAALAIVILLWWRAIRTPLDFRAIERNALLFVVGPIAIFLLLAAVPANLHIDVFHDGEHLAAATLTGQGRFPWRDLISIHGPFEDSLWPLFGLRVFGNTYWGVTTALTLLVAPLFYASLFVLLAWMVRRNWALVLTFGLLLLAGRYVPFVGARYVFWPLILLLLAAVIHWPAWWLCALLGVSLAVQAVLIPEMAYALPAVGIALILADWYRRPVGAGRKLLSVFPRSLLTLAGGGGIAIILLVVLLIEGAVGDFVFYYRVFAVGHALQGGLHLDVHDWNFYFAFVALTPVIAILIAWWYDAAKIIRGARLDAADWTMAAAAIFALLYYTKYLGRADLPHAQESYNAAVPLIGFLVFRFMTFVDRVVVQVRWSAGLRGLTLQPASVAVLLLALVATTVSGVVGAKLPSHLTAAASAYRPVVAAEPAISRLGYGATGVDLATYQDLSRILHAYLRSPNDWVFDFSNEPALYYFLLGFQPHMRYDNVSSVIPEVAQKDMVAQLERDPPKLVVFTNSLLGLPGWDGIPNEVRHYEVAQYILDHYRPLLMTHTQVLYGLDSASLSATAVAGLALNEPISTDNLYFQAQSCDWGYAPNFLSISPPPPASPASPVTVGLAQPASSLSMAGWAVDPLSGTPAREVVAVVGSRVVAATGPSIERPDVADALGIPADRASGFLFTAPGDSRVRVFAVSNAGVASELKYGPGASPQLDRSGALPASITLDDGTVIPVKPGTTVGTVDTMTLSIRTPLSLPAAAGAWSRYRWLEISTASGFQLDGWTLSDQPPGYAAREIDFRTQPSSPTTLRVYVGNCAQWHGYQGQTLYLNHSATESITGVRLLP